MTTTKIPVAVESFKDINKRKVTKFTVLVGSNLAGPLKSAIMEALTGRSTARFYLSVEEPEVSR